MVIKEWKLGWRSGLLSRQGSGQSGEHLACVRAVRSRWYSRLKSKHSVVKMEWEQLEKSDTPCSTIDL